MGALDLRDGSETVFRARRLDDTAGRIEGGLYTHVGRVQQDRVFGLHHRRRATPGVAFVAALTRYRLWDVEILTRETVASWPSSASSVRISIAG